MTPEQAKAIYAQVMAEMDGKEWYEERPDVWALRTKEDK